jgi:Flp pilus assembly protein TadG
MLFTHKSAPYNSRSGQAAMLAVLSLTTLFGVLGLAVDLGWAYYRRNVAQAAADSAAMAAAVYAIKNGYTCGTNGLTCGAAVTCNNPPTSPAANQNDVGCLYAKQNGFVNVGKQTVKMTANDSTTAPPGMSGNTPTFWIQAEVSENNNNVFGSFAGMRAFNIKARATAGVSVSPTGACIYALDPGVGKAFLASGNSNTTSACGIYVNSNNASNAFYAGGGSVVNATRILVNGTGISIANNASISPSPTTNAGSVTDPLINVPAPTVPGTCDHSNWSVNSGATITISPGTYCGGITVSGGATVHLQSGTYILNGGGLNVNSASFVDGTDVMFFNTGQNGRSASPIGINGSSYVNVAAPTSGVYQGILFFQDRTVNYGSANVFNGSNTSKFQGSLYFPTTDLTFTGTTAGSYTALVARTITMNGNSVLQNDITGLFTGINPRITALLQ